MRNFILSTFSALFLGFIAAGAQNPTQPAAGTYYIVNSVLSSSGEKLAATYQNDHPDVIVTPLTNSDVQRWSITLGAQFIIPVNDQSVAATGEVGTTVSIRPKDGFVWTITKIAGTTANYTIADQSRYWGLEDAIINEIIELEPRSDILTQSWVLEPVEPVN